MNLTCVLGADSKGAVMGEILDRVWNNLIGRLTGPMNFRLLVQPAAAIFFAVRSGLKDAHEGRPGFFWGDLSNPRRAIGVDRSGLEGYRGPLRRCWLANTDADCIVPKTWLTEQLILAERDIEAVAGTVDVDSFHEHDPGVLDHFRSTYSIELDGSHPHVHGANLGVRADLYRNVGGWAPLETAEDHDFWNRLS